MEKSIETPPVESPAPETALVVVPRPVGTTSDPGIRFVEGSLVAPRADRRRGAMALSLVALASLLVYGSGGSPPAGSPPALSLSTVRGFDQAEQSAATAVPVPSEGASAAPIPPARPPLAAGTLKMRVKQVVSAAIPSTDALLEERFQEMLHIAESLEYHGINLPAKQEQAFVERFQKVKRLHLLQSTTRELDTLASGYQVPPPGEKARIHEDLERLQALARSIEWVESRYSFQYSKALKAHLLQTIEILASEETL